jgi:hypothetical protein
VLKLEISYRVLISLEGFLVFLSEDFFLKIIYFCMVKYLNFHNSSFALRILVNVKWQGHSCDTPLVFCV